MAHIALYRKYRSASFDEVVGQEHVTRTLANAIDRGTFVHAFLFSGPRGCGKTSTARLVAQALNCEKGPTSTACGECKFCVDIPAGKSVDVVEMDAASETGIQDIRDSVIEAAKYAPMECRYKVYIIDEVHDLSKQAFDGLLKIIEEPPPHVIFILATTELNKVPATIRSRCQKHEFRRGSLPNIMARLQTVVEREGLQVEPAALAAIAQMADGGYRDSLSLLEQVAATAEGPIGLDQVHNSLGFVPEEVAVGLLQAMADADARRVLTQLDEVLNAGREPRQVLESLIHKVGELARVASGVAAQGADANRGAMLHDQAVRIGKDNLARFWPALAEAHSGLRTAGMPRLWLEMTLHRLCDRPAPVPAQREAQTTAVVQPAPKPQTPSQKRREPASIPPVPDEADLPEEVRHVGALWRKMLSVLFTRSKGAATSLAGSHVVEVREKHVLVEIPSPKMFDKLTDPADKSAKELLKNFREAAGDAGWTLGYKKGNHEEGNAAAPAEIPMPLEGEQLEHAIEVEMGGERIS